MVKQAVLGCELNDLFLQISYAAEGETPITLRNGAGGEILQIPLMVTKDKSTGELYFGQEAMDRVTGLGANTAHSFLTKLGESVTLLGENYQYTELLRGFLDHALEKALLCAQEMEGSNVETTAVMLSVEPFLPEMRSALEGCLHNLSLPRERFFLQGHEESIFAYLIHQPERLLGYVTGIFDLTGEKLVTYCMEMNPSTTPVVTSVVREETGLIRKKHYPSIMEHDRALAELDQQLAEYVEGFTAGRIVTSIYLIGDGFAKDWYTKSRHVLCRNRKVYAGNNLFSKGAAYSMASRLWPGTEREDFLFLGRDMLRFNVGMKIWEGEKESYLPLLDAGSNWYDAKTQTEVLMEKPDSLTFKITPIFRGKAYEEEAVIGEDEMREGRAFRFRVELSMKDAQTLSVRITDEGFGSFYPPKFVQKEFEFSLRE
ncbi:MAG: hypothetical protein K5739_02775 [Lachnospiraceae bacterium]|nr:hypothetical protein [Lachnospiraceae bacterium]